MLALAFAIMCLALPETAAARTNFAILIGATDYPNIDKRFWLQGPKYDVELVDGYLRDNPAAGFEEKNIAVLADGVEGAKTPTLANIRDAFAELAGRLQPGDFVYLHFSGHGSQAPAEDPESELDGLDELFLPVDIGPWSDNSGHVKNALVDDEIGTLVDSLRARGANVWAVFDSCHSGTVTRGAPSGDDEVRMRKLDPAALGIPQARLDAVEGVRTRGGPGAAPRQPSFKVDAQSAPGKGALVAFFAAQTTETTPEMRLPAGKKGRKPHGLFTWTIFEALAEYPGMTYRQLGQEVLRRYATQYLVQPTPLFEGDLDKPVFDVGAAQAVRQWPVSVADGAFTIPAGALHQLAEGEYLALLPGPAVKTEDAVGYMRVASADSLSSTLVPAEHEGRSAPAEDTIAEGFYVRRVTADIDFGLKVALPDYEGVDPAVKEKVEAAVAAVADHAGAGLRLEEVAAGEPADIRLSVMPAERLAEAGADPALAGHLWLLPPTGQVVFAGSAKSPSIDLAPKTPDEVSEALADNLTRIARAVNLLKLGGSYAASELDVEVELQTRNKQNPKLASLDSASVPLMHPGDEIHLRARNMMDVPVDINVLYVASDYSISHMWKGRAQPGDTLTKGLLRINDKSFGRERVVMIMTPAKPQTAVEDLGFLQQSAVPTTRGGPGAAFRSALTEAGFGSVTRGAVALDTEETGPSGAILQFDLETGTQQ
ncbi:MAG: caspase family protein [Flavobacteriaceae bacterium]